MEFLEANAFIDDLRAVSIMTGDERAYLFRLASDPQNHPVMEVGSAAGGTTILLALAAGECWTLDNGAGEDHRLRFHSNIEAAGLTDRIHFFLADATEHASMYPDASFGMVLVDAEHEREHPYNDITAWAPKVKSGGYLLIDDFSDSNTAVTRAVVRFLTENHGFLYDVSFEREEGFRQIKLLSLKKREKHA